MNWKVGQIFIAILNTSHNISIVSSTDAFKSPESKNPNKVKFAKSKSKFPIKISVTNYTVKDLLMLYDLMANVPVLASFGNIFGNKKSEKNGNP